MAQGMSYAPSGYQTSSQKKKKKKSGGGPTPGEALLEAAGKKVYIGPASPAKIKEGKKRGVTYTPSDPNRKVSRKSTSTYSARTADGDGAPTEAEQKAQAEAAAAKKEAAEAKAAAARAEAKAIAQANSSAKGTAQSNIDDLNASIKAKRAQLSTNNTSADALKTLVEGGLSKSRDTNIKALDDALKTKLGAIQATFETSLADFNSNLRDNESSEADASFANLGNRAREKGDLVTQALSQGAGESDVLKSQLQALRNWSANQGDVNRSFFDTRTSINSGITDLNNSTKTSRINEENSTNAAKGSVWDDYYGSTADTYTQLANLDQQNYLLNGEIDSTEEKKSESQRILDWLADGKNIEDYVPADKKQSKAATMPQTYTSMYAKQAAQAAGQTWENPGTSKETEEFTGGATSGGGLNTADPSAVSVSDPGAKKKRPEGAGLRKW
jgi:hypothetical protein